MKDQTFDLTHFFENQRETPAEGETVTTKGSIPEWVKGTIFTAGPGKFKFEETGFTVNHFVDGYAMTCKLELRGNKATLWKKYEESDALKKAKVAGKTVLAEFFTQSSPDVTKNALGRFMTIIPENSDNGNHTVYLFGNRIYTSNGLAYFREINPVDLSTGMKFDTNKYGMTAVTPHPLIDHDGSLYNAGGAVSATGAKQIVFRIPAPKPGENFKECAKKMKTVASFPMQRLMFCNMHHSFTLSENHIVLIEQPYMISVKKMLSLLVTGQHNALQEICDWHPEEINRFVIIDKHTGKIHKRKIISSEPFFFLHMVNCYEDKDRNQLILDVVTYPDDADFHMLSLDKVGAGHCCTTESSGILKRFIIPLDENFEGARNSFGAKANAIDPGSTSSLDLVLTGANMSKRGIQNSVTINPNYRFRKYQYGYAISGFFLQGPYGRRITKIDLTTLAESFWECESDCNIADIIFIPNPNATEEDDGVLVSGVAADVHKGQLGRFFVFICAKTMTELGRAEFQHGVPLYVHGIFVPSMF